MNIAIVGAGIAGISTALELALDGHHVTLYEQRNGAAEGASFAPGGWLSPCAPLLLSTPGSGMPLKQLHRSLRPLLQAPGWPGSANWRWLRQWKKREKLAATDSSHTAALQALADHSQQLRHALCDDLDLASESKTRQLVLLRKAAEVDFWQARLPGLHAQGVAAQLITAAQACELEPSLSPDMPLAGALHLPQGESMNGRLWTQYLRHQALAMGVQLHTGATVRAVRHQPAAVQWSSAATASPPGSHADGTHHTLHTTAHDAVVLCTGADTALLSGAGLNLPLLPLWGYSVTAPVRDPLQAPRTTVMDWQQQTTIARLGQRVRISAGAELNSTADTPHNAPTLARMYQLLHDWFPGGALLSSPQVQVWRGVRGMLPDGLPVVGASAKPGIWVNLAHGSHGLGVAAGCARAMADLIAGRPPAVDMHPFRAHRF